MTQTCKLIDIIIPAYNAHETIIRTLGSIVCQTISDKCIVTIVNDCGKDYSHIIEQFSKLIDIQEVDMPENKGPGVARQVGIDNTSCPYLTFIDADDTFYGALALEIFLGTFEHYSNCKMVISSFVEQAYDNEKLVLAKRQENIVWVFGKMYKRDFIRLNNIHFNETRSNEDTGFNLLYFLCLPNTFKDETVYLDDYFYAWHYNVKSITRRNNCEYSYVENMPGFVENMIFAIKEAEKRNPFNDKIGEKKIDVMVALYYLYCKLSSIHPEFKKNYLIECVRYYNEILKDHEPTITKESFNKQVQDSFGKRLEILKEIAQELTLRQFLQAIRSATYDKNN